MRQFVIPQIQKTGEFKLVRVKGEKLEKHDPDVIGIFCKHVEKSIAGMTDFYKDAKRIHGRKLSMAIHQKIMV